MRKLISLLILLCAAFAPEAAMAQQTDPREMAVRKLLQSTIMINQMYVDTVNIDRQVEDAITGMLSKLDPHSAYSNAKDTKKLNEPLQGNFEGIGVQFNMLEDTLVVIQPVAKGPSEKVGILAGDRIVSVNDTAIAGVKMSREDIMSRLRGPKGTKVNLGVVRRGIKDVLTFTVKRDKIPVNSLDAAFMIEPGIGLVRFSNFAATTRNEVVEAIRKLQAQGMKDLILDLQGNGGGYLQAAAEVASEFLPKGDMIVFTKGRGGMNMGEFRSTGGGLFTEGRIVVLVDEYSASAAEILAGAIQDHDRGTIVGRRTFGKGLVQRPIELEDGSMIRLTIARYYTPSGRCIQKPYEKGDAKSYAHDVIDRYNRGELTNADSIHFPDSLRYTTLNKKRTVYGGGGIMPDIFIPEDTTLYTSYFREAVFTGLTIQYAFLFTDEHRDQLNRFRNVKDMVAWLKQQNLLEQFARYGEQHGLKRRNLMLQRSAPLFERNLIANIVYNAEDQAWRLQYLSTVDPAVLRAQQMLADGQSYPQPPATTDNKE